MSYAETKPDFIFVKICFMQWIYILQLQPKYIQQENWD